MEPLISVIIPVYKSERYLRQCVDSVLSQDFKDIEVILVDDGSPDGCPSICDEYALKHSNVKAVHQENGGSSAARDRGIREASGEYLIFLDSDDWWQNDGELEQLVEKLKTRLFDVVGFTSVSVSDLNQRRNESNPGIDVSRISGRPKLEALDYMRRSDNLFGAAWRLAIRRSLVLNKNIYFPEGLVAEDYDWLSRMYCHLRTIDYVKADLVIYRKFVPGSITATVSPKNARSILKIAEIWDYKLKTEAIDCREVIKAVIGRALLTIFSQIGLFEPMERKDIVREMKKYNAFMTAVKVKRYRCIYLFYRLFGAMAAYRLSAFGIGIRRRRLYGR